MTVDRRAMPRALGAVGRLVLVALLVVGLVLALEDPFTILFYGSYALAGALLVIRRPRNSIGWLLLLIGIGFIGTTARRDLDLDALVAGTATTRDFLLAWFGSWAGGLTFTAFLALTILFPSGHLPGGRSRVLATRRDRRGPRLRRGVRRRADIQLQPGRRRDGVHHPEPARGPAGPSGVAGRACRACCSWSRWRCSRPA